MKTTQFGWSIVVALVLAILLMLSILIIVGFDKIPLLVIFGFVTAILVFCIVFFYKLTIIIDQDYISFSFGVGLFSRKYRLAEIKSCVPVRNSFLDGIGIRITPDGMLYNVSGFKAIELTFKNKTQRVRIGTDKPDEIAEYLNSLIGKATGDYDLGNTQEKSSRRVLLYVAIGAFLIVSLLIPLYTIPFSAIFFGNPEFQVKINDADFQITGMYGETLKYSDISHIELVSELPKIKLRTNGYASEGICRGYFEMDKIGSGKLFVNIKQNLFIHITTKQNKHIFLNFKDKEKTKEIFDQIIGKMKINSALPG